MAPPPSSPRRRPARRAFTWIVAALALSVAGAAGFAWLGREAIANGRRLLDEGRPAEAAHSFEPHVKSPFVGRAARAGLAVSRAATGQPVPIPADVATEARSFDLPALAEQAVAGGHWQGADTLAAVAGGDLPARVRQARTWQEAGARTIVRDRDGRGLGWLTAEGAFHAVDPAVVELLPVAALSRAAAGAGAVRLTIDVGLSRLARESLGAHRGSIVLLDPATGAILAAVSDPRTVAAEGGTPAFEQLREPASIQKLVTSTATFRAGLDANAEVAQMSCPGQGTYGERTLYCVHPPQAWTGLGPALAVSCNVAFANLGVRLGLAKVVEELRRYGFDRPAGLVRWGRLKDTQPAALADLSIGLEATDITPVHAAALGAVFAAGRLPDPALVTAEDGMLGLTPRRREAAAPQPVVEARFLPPMWKAMEDVTAEGGTAEHLDPTFPVVMKTGTAAEDALGYHVNYVGVGPLPNPQVAFAIRLTHEGSSRSVNAVAREVTRSLFVGLGQRYAAGATEVP